MAANLPGDRRLFAGRLKDSSSAANRTVAESQAAFSTGGLHLLAVLRGEHMLAPRGDLTLQVGDGVILVVESDSMTYAAEHASAW